MSRGFDRSRTFLALSAGLMTILTALWTGAYFGSLYAPEKSHYQTVGPNGGQQYPANRPKNGLADVTGIDALTERMIAKPQPRNANERENRDLAAQEAVAVFTYWMFSAVILQTLLSGGALIALIKDLRQNQRTAEAQLRAYVSAEFVQIRLGFHTGEAEAELVLFNGGQTPAYDCCHAGNIVILDDDQAEVEFAKKNRPASDAQCRSLFR